MKKILVLLAVFGITLSTNAMEQAQNLPVNKAMPQKMVEHKMNREVAFEKRLGLTEVQKLKAREIRKNGLEKLKPVLEEIKSKQQEAEMIRRSRMAIQMQEEKLTLIDTELKSLEKKAQAIRKANMKEFESILTREQKRTLKNMKKEGRKIYYKNHPVGKPHICPHK